MELLSCAMDCTKDVRTERIKAKELGERLEVISQKLMKSLFYIIILVMYILYNLEPYTDVLTTTVIKRPNISVSKQFIIY